MNITQFIQNPDTFFSIESIKNLNFTPEHVEEITKQIKEGHSSGIYVDIISNKDLINLIQKVVSQSYLTQIGGNPEIEVEKEKKEEILQALDNARIQFQLAKKAFNDFKIKKKELELAKKLAEEELVKSNMALLEKTSKSIKAKEEATKNASNIKRIEEEKKKIEEKRKKLEKSTPSTITIYLNTAIPEKHHIRFTPSMIRPELGYRNIYMDPLVKLYPDTIHNVSLPTLSNKKATKMIINQFFDRTLYNNLKKRTLRKYEQDIKTLEEATKEGIVDNNIELILKELFKLDTVLTIDKKPYTIYSYEWNKGDWKNDNTINTSMWPFQSSFYNKANINPKYLKYNRGRSLNSKQYQHEKRLQYLDELEKKYREKITQGITYNPKEIKSKILQIQAEKEKEKEKEKENIEKLKQKLKKTQEEIEKQNISTSNNSKSLIVKGGGVAIDTLIKKVNEAKNLETKKKYLSFIRQLLPQKKVEVEIEEDRLDVTTQDGLKKYLSKIKPLYEIMSEFFPQEYKEIIKKIRPTNHNDYDEQLNSLKIVETKEDGNCFFDAVSIGINLYNNDDKNNTQIFYDQNDPDNTTFNIKKVRTIIADYYDNKDNDDDIEEHIVSRTQDLINNMNTKFNEQIAEGNTHNIIPIETWINSIIDGIWNEYSGETISFIKKGILNSPIELKNLSFSQETISGPISSNNPFYLIDTNRNPNDNDKRTLLRDFILSPQYWADENVIVILNKVLGLKVFVFKKDENRNKLTCLDDIFYHDTQPDFSQYMFTLLGGNHYQLLTFDNIAIFTKNEIIEIEPPDYMNWIQPRDNKLWLTPDYNYIHVLPPDYIILLLYFFRYKSIIEKNKEYYKKRLIIFPNEMLIYYHSQLKMIKTNNDYIRKLRTSVLLTEDQQIMKKRLTEGLRVIATYIYPEKPKTSKQLEDEKLIRLYGELRQNVNQLAKLKKEEDLKKLKLEQLQKDKEILNNKLKQAINEEEQKIIQKQLKEKEKLFFLEKLRIEKNKKESEKIKIKMKKIEKEEKEKERELEMKKKRQLKLDENISNIGYYVSVDLYLYPGTNIPAFKKAAMECDIRYQKIKKGIAELSGSSYTMMPLTSNKLEKLKNTTRRRYSEHHRRSRRRPRYYDDSDILDRDRYGDRYGNRYGNRYGYEDRYRDRDRYRNKYNRQYPENRYYYSRGGSKKTIKYKKNKTRIRSRKNRTI